MAEEPTNPIVKGALDGKPPTPGKPTREPKAKERGREQPPADEWPYDSGGGWVDPCNPDAGWGEC